ncbi:hypothetical protein [Priestia megaterium]|uniref:hypothetical protein n=1 Tax=Priestia megaterium TaxID=1404 RepID=UPI0031FE2DEC
MEKKNKYTVVESERGVKTHKLVSKLWELEVQQGDFHMPSQIGLGDNEPGEENKSWVVANPEDLRAMGKMLNDIAKEIEEQDKFYDEIAEEVVNNSKTIESIEEYMESLYKDNAINASRLMSRVFFLVSTYKNEKATKRFFDMSMEFDKKYLPQIK